VATSHSTMTFEDFTRSMMYVIDRALEASRQSESRLMQQVPTSLSAPASTSVSQLPLWEDSSKNLLGESESPIECGNCRIPTVGA